MKPNIIANNRDISNPKHCPYMLINPEFMFSSTYCLGERCAAFYTKGIGTRLGVCALIEQGTIPKQL